MKHIHTFENFLNEGSISMYKSTVQNALKLLGYDLKQSELKVGVKKEKLYDLITLNGELLCSSSDYAQMVTWIQNAVKEDPAKYGLDPKVLESEQVNEGLKGEKLTALFTKETGIELGDRVKQEGEPGKYEVTRIWAPGDTGGMNPGLHIELTQISGGSSFGHFMAMDDNGKLTDNAKRLKKI